MLTATIKVGKGVTLSSKLKLDCWWIIKIAVLLSLVPLMLKLTVQGSTTEQMTSGTSETKNSTRVDQMLYGRLITQYDKLVIVNGNHVKAGTTIFSGSEVETPSGTTADINLRHIGKLTLAPNSKLKFTFDHERVNAQLLSGCAVLLTDKQIISSVKTSDGKEEHADPLKGSSVKVCTAGELMTAGTSISSTVNNRAPDSDVNSVIKQIFAASSMITAAERDFSRVIRPCWRGRNCGFTGPPNYNDGCF